MSTMLVADAVAEHLRAVGIRHVYGYPGEDHIRLLDAFARQDLEYVAARSETAACLMAGVAAQATGTPAVVLITLAPGLTNAINGIANAFLDRVALLVITGQHSRDRLPVMVRQTLDNHRVVDGVVKWSATAGGHIHQTLAKALDMAAAPPAGPVYLEISEQLAGSPAEGDARRWLPQQERAAVTTARLSELSIEAAGPDLEAARSSLARARHPVLIVGGFTWSAAERAAIAGLAEATNAVVFTTPMAKGALPASNPRFAGTFYNTNFEKDLISQSDFLLLVNLEANDILNRPWPYDLETVALDRDRNVESHIPVMSRLTGDLAAILGYLGERGGGASGVDGPGPSQWRPDDIEVYRSRVEAAFTSPDGVTGLTVPDVVRFVRAAVPQDTILTVDAGFGKPIVSMLWPTEVPRTYFASHGLSTMGYAIPSANALAALYPERTVIGFLGDGSLLMSAPEISVATAMGTAPIYIVWLDDALLQIRLKQQRQGAEGVGTSIGRLSCVAIAEAFGARGFDVSTTDELRAAFEGARASRIPSLIGVRVDPSPSAEWFEVLRG